MKPPLVRGTIDRRVLVNFAVDPEVVARVLPPPFRPQVVRGNAVGGICLIRLTHIRPARLPGAVGVTSENAAHRIAVTWGNGDQEREGVFIPRRDTSSRVNTILGGRLFPGVHHHARFEVEESDTQYRVGFKSKDGTTGVLVSGRVTDALPEGSMFSSLDEVSSFFERGSVGYSATRDAARLDGLELKTYSWDIRPLAVDEVRSSFFDDQVLFPPGSARFDSALIMRGIEHEWHALEPICCDSLGEVA